MERKGRDLFDASAYMLFEASGDSEAECFTFEGKAKTASATAAVEDRDNTDAQSCSMEWAPDAAGRVPQEQVIEATDEEEDWYEDEGSGYISKDEREEEEDEEGVVDQCPIKGQRLDISRNRACEDSNAKLLNQKERDRLFWEECLAS